MIGLGLSLSLGAGRVGVVSPNIATESYVVLDMIGATSYTFPHRARPIEPGRKQFIARNLGPNAFDVLYRTGVDNSAYQGGTLTLAATVNPGQEYAEDGTHTDMIVIRPVTSGQTCRAGIYTKLGAA